MTHASFRSRAILLAGAALLCSGPVTTAQTSSPPAGAPDVPSLVKAYLSAVQAHRPEAAEALFDLTSQTPGARSAFHKHLAQSFSQQIVSTAVVDPDPNLAAEYARYNAHFPQPVVKTFKITYAAPKGEADATEYYIGSRAGRFYFVTAVQEP